MKLQARVDGKLYDLEVMEDKKTVFVNGKSIQIDVELEEVEEDGVWVKLSDEELNLLQDYRDGNIELANPYHDKLGRFASKVGSAGTGALIGAGTSAAESAKDLASDANFVGALGVIATSMAVGKAKWSKEDNTRYNKMVQDQLDKIPDNLKNPKMKVRQHDAISSYVLAGGGSPSIALSSGFVKGEGANTLHIAPMSKRWMLDSDTSKAAKIRKNFAETVIVHEALHARPREKKRGLLDKLGGATGLEEGTNDILTERVMKRRSTPVYEKYRDGVANIALMLHDGDRKKAVQWVNDTHRIAKSTKDIADEINAKFPDAKANRFSVQDYIGHGYDDDRKPPKLNTYLGEKRKVAAELNHDLIRSKKTVNIDYDKGPAHIATGLAETASAWYVTNRVKGATMNVMWGAIQGAARGWNNYTPPGPAPTRLPGLPPPSLEDDQYTISLEGEDDVVTDDILQNPVLMMMLVGPAELIQWVNKSKELAKADGATDEQLDQMDLMFAQYASTATTYLNTLSREDKDNLESAKNEL